MVRKLDPIVTHLRARRSGDNELFFPALALQRLKIAEQRKLDYKWQGRIYPSMLSFSMCPVKHVYEECQTWTPPDSDGLDRTTLGREFHKKVTELLKDYNFSGVGELVGTLEDLINSDQTLEQVLHSIYTWESLKHPDLLYGPATVPQCLIEDTRKDWQKEFASKYPAIPAVCPEKHLSGEIDLVLKIQDKPVVVDMKFPQDPDLNNWAAKRRIFPSEEYETQVCVYAEICNQLGYFDQPIETVGIVALNPFIKSSKGQATVEWYAPYSDVRKTKTQLLISNLAATVDAFKAGEEIDCAYPYCKTHAKDM